MHHMDIFQWIIMCGMLCWNTQTHAKAGQHHTVLKDHFTTIQ